MTKRTEDERRMGLTQIQNKHPYNGCQLHSDPAYKWMTPARGRGSRQDGFIQYDECSNLDTQVKLEGSQ